MIWKDFWVWIPEIGINRTILRISVGILQVWASQRYEILLLPPSVLRYYSRQIVSRLSHRVQSCLECFCRHWHRCKASIKHHQANIMPPSIWWVLIQMALQDHRELGSPVLCIVTCDSICTDGFQRPLCLQGKLRLEMISDLKSQPREVIRLQNPQS